MLQAALVLTVIAGKHKQVFSLLPQEIGFLNYPEQIVEQSQFLEGRKEQFVAVSRITQIFFDEGQHETPNMVVTECMQPQNSQPLMMAQCENSCMQTKYVAYGRSSGLLP